MMTKPRKTSLKRETTETQISVAINLDGTGKSDIETGIGFFDHMLDSLSRHSLIDLEVRTVGDLHIDMHHTVEDTGIVIGQALHKALGDFAGLTRFASATIAMDETLSRASIDLCNRPYLVWRVDFARDEIGNMDTELFKEFFHALSHNSGMCLHVDNLYGENSHHIIESCFKATARALREAISPDPRLGGKPASTKGKL